MRKLTRLHAIAAFSALAALSACNRPPESNPVAKNVGNPERGAQLIQYFGCGACHEIPGIAGADAMVGPPLDHFANRIYIAGVLRNTPDNLVLWIRKPQTVVPGNAMPQMGIDAPDARDIAAYLYTIQ
ncbi:MAG TPA: c-type cytochrome [Rhizomicrobium sp.]|jgi:cytochrome c2